MATLQDLQAPRTPENIRAKAREQYAAMQERPYLFDVTPEACKAECELGMALLEAGLTMAGGEILDLSAWFPESEADDAAKRLVFKVMPFLMGPLGVFEMEFFHKDAGQVPNTVVRALLEDGEQGRLYNGVQLTSATVLVQYRRRHLERSESQA